MLVLSLALGAAPAIAAQSMPGWRTDFSRHTVPLEEIVPGGPPKDGIPPVDRPEFEPVASAARWLGSREPVIVVEHGGVARAYPLQILVWHEIVNDVIAGMPIAVTYCPLCNTAIVFSRIILPGADTTTFGTTGRVRLSDLVMYDRGTESWWQQATGEGLVGVHAGGQLSRFPSTLVSFAEFRRNFPRGVVLSRATGHERPYGRNPYLRYDAEGASPLASLFGRRPDTRFPAMARVVVVKEGPEQLVIPFERLRRDRVVATRIGAKDLIVWWIEGTASSMDTEIIAEGREVGSAVAHRSSVDGRVLTFRPHGDATFRDTQTGTTWSALGHGISGPLTGRRLEPIDHGAYFWFAVAAFWPQARLLDSQR
ncbi:MAG: DUF3179 domain-containing protein [Gemmatimonadota bacterium]|nr:DUF3179 domain-containing protein [Gemmatimonadota bacterium]